MKIVDAVQTGLLRQVLTVLAEEASKQEQIARDAAYSYFSGGEREEHLAQRARKAVASRSALKVAEQRVQTLKYEGVIPGLKP